MIEKTLNGMVVGIGKVHKDGSKDFNWLDKPIHNKIVRGGLDYLMTFNGSNSALKEGPTWRGSSTGYVIYYNRWRRTEATESSYSNYSGCLQYLAVGTSGDPSSFDDTSLHSQIGTYNDEVPFRNAPYNGTNFDVDTNTIQLRITLQSVEMDDSYSIREVGWHGKYYNQAVYPMFSRVVLPVPVTLEVGERLIVCYQININEYSAEHDVSSFFTGLFDSEGNALKVTCQRRIYVQYPEKGWIDGNYSGNGVSNKLIQIPYSISTSGYGRSVPHNSVFLTMGPVFVTNGSSDGGFFSSGNLVIPKSVDDLIPRLVSIGSLEPRASRTYYDYDNAHCSYTQLDYTPGSFIRDRIVTIGPAYPNINSGYKDIPGFSYAGAIFRFGYYDNTDPSNPVWVQKYWRKEFNKSYEFTFRYKFDTIDTIS